MTKTTAIIAMLSALTAYAQLEVVRVLPNKINYKLKEQAVISVTIANRGKQPETAELVLMDQWDLDQGKPIAKKTVNLKPETEQTIQFPWNTGTVRYGHETRASLVKNGKTLSAKSEFFNVINEWGRVNIGIWPNVIGGTPQGDRLCKWYGLKPYNTKFARFYFQSWGNSPIGPFASYFTNFTPWNMAFSSFGVYYDPSYKDDDLWHAVAEGAEGRKYKWFKQDTEFSKKWGVHRTMYLTQCVTGNPGFDLMRQHPQWFFKDTKGDFRYQGGVDPLGLSKSPKYPYWSGWSHTNPNFFLDETIKFGIDTALDGVKRLGFNGIYFDGIYCTNYGHDHNGQIPREIQDPQKRNYQISDYVVKRFQKFRKDVDPDFYHWSNGNPGPKTKFAGCRIFSDPNSGCLWEIGMQPLMERVDYMNVISSLKEAAVKVRNDVWYRPGRYGANTNIIHVGYTSIPDGLWMVGPSAVAWGRRGLQFENFLKSNQFWCINSHLCAILTAMCSHPYSMEGAGFRPFSQVMTRYSDFYWNEDITIFHEAPKVFTQDSLREIWWEDFVYTRKTKDHTDYYIHLLNAPDVPRFSYRTLKETHHAKGVEIATAIFKNPAKVKAWSIQPYDSTTPILEPVVNQVIPEQVDGELAFTVPPFRYYTLLVIREKH